jgi:hypothetical protein
MVLVVGTRSTVSLKSYQVPVADYSIPVLSRSDNVLRSAAIFSMGALVEEGNVILSRITLLITRNDGS